MKIVFLCGSLEPGRNGVGDYVRFLASELINLGYTAAAVALNDRHLTQEVTGTLNSEGIALPVLRLPSIWAASKRFKAAQLWVDTFDPEWVSLQYVPFSFQLKGLPFGLSNRLRDIGFNRRWHFMFHELWVGQNIEASTKHILWGRVQQLLIKSLVRELKPTVIHTQSNLHLALLAKHHIYAKYLPLFANIPVTNPKCRCRSKKETKVITFVMFGMIHPSAPVAEFASEVAVYARTMGVKFLLVIIGRSGIEQDVWVNTWKTAGLMVEVLGELSSIEVSEVLSQATLGISTTPISRIEKSGTVAAMFDHNLPVICVSEIWTPRGITCLNYPSGVVEYTIGSLENILSNYPTGIEKNNVKDVSKKLAYELLEVK